MPAFHKCSKLLKKRRKAAVLAMREEARQILVRTALTYITEAQKPELFDDLSAFTFGTDAVKAFDHRGKLFAALLKIAGDDELAAEPTDPFCGPLQSLTRDALLRKREALASQGRDLAKRYNSLQNTSPPAKHGGLLSTAWFALRRDAQPANQATCHSSSFLWKMPNHSRIAFRSTI